jgi:hypothetical protein
MGERRPGNGEGPGRKRRRRRGLRRWCLPPPWTREPGEMLEGMFVLEELPPDLALALWTAFRDVMLWAGTPEERRAGLFSPGAEARRPRIDGELRLPPPLTPPLTTLATVVSHPGQVSEQVVSLSCMEVARWAREQRAMGTAVSFAQAAALAWPDAPAPGLEVGRLLVEWGRLHRAETWLRRAIGLARRARDWESYGSAYVSLGEIYLRFARGAGGRDVQQAPRRLEGAARFYEQASRVSRRHRLRLVRAQAMHGLMRVSMEKGALEQAERCAHLARRAYGRVNPRLPELEFDMTRLMMRRGEYERAIPVLQRQVDMAADADRKLACGAMLAHAAAQVGDRPLYERSWSTAWGLLDGRRGSPAAPDTLVHLGRAAAHIADWLRVQQVVRAFGELPPDPPPPPAAVAAMEEIAELGRRH